MRFSFIRPFTDSDLPSDRLGQLPFLRGNTRYITIEYKDSEGNIFHAMRMLVNRAYLKPYCDNPDIKPTVDEMLDTVKIEMLYSDGPHKNNTTIVEL